jgi:hypothetical protein
MAQITSPIENPSPAGTNGSAPAPFAEAPASCTVKFQIGKIDVLYTMRDRDDDALFARIRRLLPRIEEKVNTPPEDPAETPPEGWCALHKVQMPRHANGKGTWWSHKLADGTWCRGQ